MDYEDINKSFAKWYIQWTPWRELEDLDFADDVVSTLHTHHQMQKKINKISAISTQTGLRINKRKTKVPRTDTQQIKLDEESLEDVTNCTYRGSIVDMKGGTDEDVKARNQKAMTAFKQLSNICNSKDVQGHTLLKVFNSNVKAVFL